MNKPAQQSTGKSIEIRLTGDIGLEHIDIVLSQLKEASRQPKDIHIKLDDITFLDLSTIQVLQSLHRKLEHAQYSLFFEFPDEWIQLLNTAGFSFSENKYPSEN